ncbi:MAG: hypothetical protein WDN75_05215 [Bacteroidota bacterium]
MKNAAFLSLFFIISHVALSQTENDSTRISGKKIDDATDKIDSLNSKLNSKLGLLSVPKTNDTTSAKAMHKVDSIRSNFQASADSLQRVYGKPINKMDSVGRGLQHRIDSLNSLRLPTGRLTSSSTASRAQEQRRSPR